MDREQIKAAIREWINKKEDGRITRADADEFRLSLCGDDPKCISIFESGLADFMFASRAIWMRCPMCDAYFTVHKAGRSSEFAVVPQFLGRMKCENHGVFYLNPLRYLSYSLRNWAVRGAQMRFDQESEGGEDPGCLFQIVATLFGFFFSLALLPVQSIAWLWAVAKTARYKKSLTA